MQDHAIQKDTLRNTHKMLPNASKTQFIEDNFHEIRILECRKGKEISKA